MSVPPLAMALGKYTGPNTIPLAALIALIALDLLHREGQKARLEEGEGQLRNRAA
jgi:hypothetical protein